MPKNCSAKIEDSQKLLMKVLKCLWTQYVSNRTSATKAYLASPSKAGYSLMAAELTAIGDLLNTNDAIVALNALVPVDGVPSYVNISSAYANGNIAYLYSDFNINPELNANVYPGPTEPNIGTTKSLQILNTDDCINQAYQVAPAQSHDSTQQSITWVTVATVVERSGCPGVSNTGFVTLSIEADNTAFAFNSCPSINCAHSKCK